MSDGSDLLYFVDGETLKVQRKIRVYDPALSKSIKNLNELEFAKGHIYANVWHQDLLVKIDPETGYVVKSWNLTSLVLTEMAFQKDFKIDGKYEGDTLNGVAFSSNSDSFFLSGKKFHLIFKLKLNEE